jgi:hypothetical protein
MPLNPNQWKKPTQQDHYTSNHVGWNKGGPQNPPAGGVGAKKPSGPKKPSGSSGVSKGVKAAIAINARRRAASAKK